MYIYFALVTVYGHLLVSGHTRKMWPNVNNVLWWMGSREPCAGERAVAQCDGVMGISSRAQPCAGDGRVCGSAVRWQVGAQLDGRVCGGESGQRCSLLGIETIRRRINHKVI